MPTVLKRCDFVCDFVFVFVFLVFFVLFLCFCEKRGGGKGGLIVRLVLTITRQRYQSKICFSFTLKDYAFWVIFFSLDPLYR